MAPSSQELEPPANPARFTAIDVLARDHKQLHKAMIASRQILTDHLILGLEGHEPFGCSNFGQLAVEGKFLSEDRLREAGWSGPSPVDLPFALLELDTPWLVRSRDTSFEGRGSVAELLDRLAEGEQQVIIRVAKRIDLEPVERADCAPSTELQPQQQVAIGALSFKGAELAGNKVAVSYEGSPFGMEMQQQQQQSYFQSEIINIDADVVEIKGPSAIELMTIVEDVVRKKLGADLQQLSSYPSALSRLRADYGYLPIGYTVSTAGAALVQGYAGATVLGLPVTARRLSLVIAVAAVGLTAMLLAEAAVAAHSKQALRDPAPDGVRATLSSSLWGRVASWSVAPAIAILFAAPFTGRWIAAAVLAVCIGASATWLAARADQSNPATEASLPT